MNVPETQSWRGWTLDGQTRMGGYVTRYQVADPSGSFDYLTVRGSGHMVRLCLCACACALYPMHEVSPVYTCVCVCVCVLCVCAQVPEYEPASASVMLHYYLSGQDWPKYNPSHRAVKREL